MFAAPHKMNDGGEERRPVLRSLTICNAPVMRIMPDILSAPESIRDEVQTIAAAEGGEVEYVEVPAGEITAANDQNGGEGAATMEDDSETSAPQGSATAQEGSASDNAAGREQEEAGATLAGTDTTASSNSRRKRMKEVAQILKLAEDTDEATVLAEVTRVVSERDAAVAEVAKVTQESRETEISTKLSEAIQAGSVLPAEEEALKRLATTDLDTFDAILASRKGIKLVDAGEHGSAAPSTEPEYDASRPDAELADKVQKKLEADPDLGYEGAWDAVLMADQALADRYQAFQLGR
jgi:hypothetical protein